MTPDEALFVTSNTGFAGMLSVHENYYSNAYQYVDSVYRKLLDVYLTPKYYYEGPCRFGQGETLQPGYDRLANAQMQKEILDQLKTILPAGVELMEPVKISRTDNWDNKEAMYEAAAAAADVFFTYNRIASDDIVDEFVQRFRKPTVICPNSGFAVTIHTASLSSKNDNLEVYGGYETGNCTQLVYFRVKDQADFFQKQCLAGNHCSLVYGDFVKELVALADAFGIEALVAD